MGAAAQFIYVQGRYAYITSPTTNELLIYDISVNPSNPTYAGESTGTPASLFGLYAVYVQGIYAYVTSWNNDSLYIFNVSNPANAAYIGGVSPAVGIRPDAVYVQGNYAYMTTNWTGQLDIINISNPTNPTVVAQTASSAYVSPPSQSVYVQVDMLM